MILRGYLALLVACTGLLLFDPVERFLIAPYVKLRPSARTRVLTRWIRFIAAYLRHVLNVVGGAEIPRPPEIEGGDGVLVLMNHQSLIDVPLVVSSVTGVYTRVVTRRRYAAKIPLISHLIGLYQYPVVDPAANREDIRKSLKQIDAIARDEGMPLAIFPEGTRTKDGEIARFKTSGLKVILGARRWTVYAIVVDGFWGKPRFKDFLRGVSDMRGKIELAGRFEWDDPEADAMPFIQEIQSRMVETLKDMRDDSSA